MATNTGFKIAKVGDIIRFPYGNAITGGGDHIGYVVSKDKYNGMLRVCTKPGTYFWVDDYTVV